MNNLKKCSLPVFLFLIGLSILSFTAPETAKLFLNGKEIKDKISLKSTGKIEIVLPQGWRYISGKVKILQGDEVKTSKQVTGDAGLKDFDLLQFIKQNAVPGNHVSLEFSVRTKESSTLSTMKFPVE